MYTRSSDKHMQKKNEKNMPTNRGCYTKRARVAAFILLPTENLGMTCCCHNKSSD